MHPHDSLRQSGQLPSVESRHHLGDAPVRTPSYSPLERGHVQSKTLSLFAVQNRLRACAFLFVALACISVTSADAGVNQAERILVTTASADRYANDTIQSLSVSGRDARFLGLGFSPAWAPGRTLIAFTRIEKFRGMPSIAGLYLMDSEGKHVRRLADAYPRGQISFSPDGKQIAFSCRQRRQAPEPPSSFGSAICLIGSEGGKPRLLAAEGIDPAFSPSGKLISFTDGESIFTITANGSSQARVGSGQAAAWLPDGRLSFARADGALYLSGNKVARGIGAAFAWYPSGSELVYAARDGRGITFASVSGTSEVSSARSTRQVTGLTDVRSLAWR